MRNLWKKFRADPELEIIAFGIFAIIIAMSGVLGK